MVKLNDIEFVLNEDIKNLSTIKTLGNVGGVYYPKNKDELVFVYNLLMINNINFVILGKGSNVLFSQDCDKLIVLSLKKMKKEIKKYRNVITVASSVTLPEAFQFCYKRNLSCFEKLSTIPGTVGGALINNAGCFGANIFDNLISVKILKNGRIIEFAKEQLQFNYRHTNLDGLILSAKFSTTPKRKCELIKIASECISKRNKTQPKGFSLGCTFKNPAEYPAGYLIEQCGLKGESKNDAIISPIHANFIINKNNATYQDIKYLIDMTTKKVKKKFGINLELEIKILP